jgi:hypothetical protein
MINKDLTNQFSIVLPERLIFFGGAPKNSPTAAECKPAPQLTFEQKRFMLLQSRLQSILNPNSSFMRSKEQITVGKKYQILTIKALGIDKGIYVSWDNSKTNKSETFHFDSNMKLIKSSDARLRQFMRHMRYFGKLITQTDKEYEKKDVKYLRKNFDFKSFLRNYMFSGESPDKRVTLKIGTETLTITPNKGRITVIWKKGKKEERYILDVDDDKIKSIYCSTSLQDLFPHFKKFKAKLNKAAMKLRRSIVDHGPFR